MALDQLGLYVTITATRFVNAEYFGHGFNARLQVTYHRHTIARLRDFYRQREPQLTLLPMDLNRLDKIDTIGPGIAQRFGRLDMFIGNAAMLGPLSPVGHVTPKDWEKVMAVNFMANVRLVRTLDPLLRASPAGLAAFVITGLLMKPGAYWGPYIASKAALNAFAQVYADEVKQTQLRVKTFDPGLVQTAMLDEAFPGGFQGKTTNTQEAAQKFMRDML